MMKKILIILVTMVFFGISANAIVFRGTNKMCGGREANEATLTLKSNGEYQFYYDYQTYDGKYSAENGYINLYENGKKVFSFPYSYTNNTLKWVDVKGIKFYKCK